MSIDQPGDPSSPRASVSIRDFGAVGDGTTKDTKAVQAAIDACHRSGGGTVIVPPGVFLIGTIYLRDNINLHLAPGATLKASTDRADYNADDAFAQNQIFRTESVTGAHLILAIEAENVSITGHGVIDGSGPAFFRTDTRTEKDDRWEYGDWRPGQMVYFCECTDVTVRDVFLKDSPYWNLFLHGCEHVVVHGLTIRNEPQSRTGDGIDIDSSRNVRVSACDIATCDDAVTVRGNAATLKDPSKRAENVIVTGCVLRSRACGVRVGVGSGTIRDCIFSDLVIKDSKRGFCVLGNYSPRSKGVDIRDVRLSDSIVEAVTPISISTGCTDRPVREIVLSSLKMRGTGASFIGGMPDNPVSDVTLRDIDLDISGGERNYPETPTPIELWQGEGKRYGASATGMPCVLYVENATDIRFDNFRVRRTDQQGLWQQALRFRKCERLEFLRTRIDGFEDLPPDARVRTEDSTTVG